MAKQKGVNENKFPEGERERERLENGGKNGCEAIWEWNFFDFVYFILQQTFAESLSFLLTIR